MANRITFEKYSNEYGTEYEVKVDGTYVGLLLKNDGDLDWTCDFSDDGKVSGYWPTVNAAKREIRRAYS